MAQRLIGHAKIEKLIVLPLAPPPRGLRPMYNIQILVEETEELVKAGIAAVRADIAETPAWHGAPHPTDEFLLMFLRAEMFSPKMAGARYRSFWEVRVGEA